MVCTTWQKEDEFFVLDWSLRDIDKENEENKMLSSGPITAVAVCSGVVLYILTYLHSNVLGKGLAAPIICCRR